jgi:hypothetical protein
VCVVNLQQDQPVPQLLQGQLVQPTAGFTSRQTEPAQTCALPHATPHAPQLNRLLVGQKQEWPPPGPGQVISPAPQLVTNDGMQPADGEQ